MNDSVECQKKNMKEAKKHSLIKVTTLCSLWSKNGNNLFDLKFVCSKITINRQPRIEKETKKKNAQTRFCCERKEDEIKKNIITIFDH